MMAEDGILFNSQTFSDIFVDFKTLPEVYNVDVLVTSPSPVTSISLEPSNNGGYINSTVGLNIGLVLDGQYNNEAYTSADGVASIFFQVLPMNNGLRAYVPDFVIYSVTPTKGNIDIEAANNFFNPVGLAGLGYLNQVFGEKIVQASHYLFMDLSNPDVMINSNNIQVQVDVLFALAK